MNGTNQPPMMESPYRTPAGPPPMKADNRAVISMVLGIIATVLCCLPAVGPACGIIAIVLYTKFNRDFNASGQKLGGKGMGIAGLVTGIIGTALGFLYTIYWIIWGVIMGTAGTAFWKMGR
jgi:hypothetical protein